MKYRGMNRSPQRRFVHHGPAFFVASRRLREEFRRIAPHAGTTAFHLLHLPSEQFRNETITEQEGNNGRTS